MNKIQNKKGFTLVELVVVIAILAILAAIAIPVVTSVINSASKSSAASNASTIELAIKEAKADIIAKNTETYGSDINTPANMTVKVVATKKAITDAFGVKNYNNVDYYPAWDNNTGKVVFITNDSNKKDMDNVAHTNATILYDTTTKGPVTSGITGLKEPAGGAAATGAAATT